MDLLTILSILTLLGLVLWLVISNTKLLNIIRDYNQIAADISNRVYRNLKNNIKPTIEGIVMANIATNCSLVYGDKVILTKYERDNDGQYVTLYQAIECSVTEVLKGNQYEVTDGAIKYIVNRDCLYLLLHNANSMAMQDHIDTKINNH